MDKMKAWYGPKRIFIHFRPNIDVSGGYWRLLFSGPALNIASKLLLEKRHSEGYSGQNRTLVWPLTYCHPL